MSVSKKLYIIGLLVHILYAIIVFSTDNIVSDCLQKDDGQLEELIIKYNYDSKSYIDSADNFLKIGIFGNGIKTDYHRTIGYPAIIALFKITLGGYWYFGLVFFQIIIGALIYPITFLIGKNLLKNNEKVLYISVLVLILLGGYFPRTLYVLTDLIFSVLFLLGVLLSILAVKTKDNIKLIIPGIIIFTIAAIIRPIMLIYPIAHILLLIYISKANSTWNYGSIKKVIWISGFVLLISCNFSSFRVNHYYGVFTPTDILGKDLLEYTTRNPYIYEGKLDEYLKIEKEIDTESNWVIKDKKRKRIFFETVKIYPVSTMRYILGRGALVHLFYPHYLQIGEIYGYFNREVNRNGKSMRKSVFMQILLYFFALVNVIIFLLFLFYIFEKLFLHKEIMFFIAIMAVVFFIVGPTFIAASSSRMRMPVEPIIIIFAFEYLFSKIKKAD